MTTSGTPAGRAERAVAAKQHGYSLAAMGLHYADQVGSVHVEVWRDAYVGLMRDDYLAGLDASRFAQGWRDLLNGQSTDGRKLVALDPNSNVVGFGTAGPTNGENPPTEWELYAINLLPSARGTGLADLLMAELVGECDATLWVVQGNERAIAFYRDYGFAPDGATEPDERRGATQLRMVRRRQTTAKP